MNWLTPALMAAVWLAACRDQPADRRPLPPQRVASPPPDAARSDAPVALVGRQVVLVAGTQRCVLGDEAFARIPVVPGHERDAGPPRALRDVVAACFDRPARQVRIDASHAYDAQALAAEAPLLMLKINRKGQVRLRSRVADEDSRGARLDVELTEAIEVDLELPPGPPR